MRLVLEPPVRDDGRKTILFIDDIFDSNEYPALKPVKGMLDKEYCCLTAHRNRRPDSTVMLVRAFCIGEYRPDLIVAYGSGATIAAQIKGIDKVLVKPYYGTSGVLKDMLGAKKEKVRVELPNFEKPEYLTIAPPMVQGYKHLEINAFQNGYNNGAHALFFAPDIDTPAYQVQIKHFGTALTVPGESLYDPEGIESVAKFIRNVMELKKDEVRPDDDGFCLDEASLEGWL